MHDQSPSRRRHRSATGRLLRLTLFVLLFLGYGAGSTLAVVHLAEGAQVLPAKGDDARPDPDWALVEA